MSSMHITLSDQLKNQLKPFAKNRDQNMSATIRYALEKLFEEEEIDPVKEAALSVVLARKFSMPRGYKLRSFWLTLFMLQGRYPGSSSKQYWGEMYYLSSVDKTHSEIFTEIIEEREQLLAEKQNGTRQ